MAGLAQREPRQLEAVAVLCDDQTPGDSIARDLLEGRGHAGRGLAGREHAKPSPWLQGHACDAERSAVDTQRTSHGAARLDSRKR
jgi:hypothetical protein